MLDQFAEESETIHEIELLAKVPITDIVVIFKTKDDWYRAREDGKYIWDTLRGKALKDVLYDLRNGYTAIPF